jgi:geranylgeranylglycerol-phosphate geranylgeranyltransferase
MLKGYYKLGRPLNALAGCLAVILGGYVAGATAWWPVIMAGITTLLITAASNAWNDYLDIEIDKVNQPHRPLPAGHISPRGALIFSLVGTALSLVTAAFINQPAFYIALGSNVLLFLYSWRLKSTVLLGNAAVATIIALCMIFGGVAAGNIQPTIWLAVTAFFAMMGREILKTMADYEGDLRQNCQTIATVWGKSIARVFVVVFLGIAAVVMLAPYFVEQYSPIYLYMLIFGVYPLLVYIAFNAKSTAPARTLERMSQVMKYDFFVWFVAVALGTGWAA